MYFSLSFPTQRFLQVINHAKSLALNQPYVDLRGRQPIAFDALVATLPGLLDPAMSQTALLATPPY